MNKNIAVLLAVVLTTGVLVVNRYSKHAVNYPSDLRDAVASPESSQSAEFSALQGLKMPELKTDGISPAPSAVKMGPLPFKLSCEVSGWVRDNQIFRKERFTASTEGPGVHYVTGGSKSKKIFYSVNRVPNDSGELSTWDYQLSVHFDKRSENVTSVIEDGLGQKLPYQKDGLPAIAIFFTENDEKIMAMFSEANKQYEVSCYLVK